MGINAQKKPKTLGSIQVLRGVAAIAVVVTHCCGAFVRFHLPSMLARWRQFSSFGACGVDIFFVISGFIMVYISRNKFGSSKAARDFMGNRIRRVVPLYWFYTSLMVLVVLAGYVLKKRAVPVALIVSSYLFIPEADWTTHQIEVLLRQGWTFEYEMLFYLLFALWLAVSPLRKARLYQGVLLVFMILGFAVSRLERHNSAFAMFAANPILFEFAFGILIALLYSSGRFPGRFISKQLLLASVLGFGITIFLPLPPQYRVFFWGLPSALLVLGALGLDRGGRKTMPQVLGDWSYSIYLSHLFVVLPLIAILRRFSPRTPAQGDAAILVITVASVFVGGASYRWVERPMMEWLNAKKKSARDKLALESV